MEPKAFCDKVVETYKLAWKELGITNDAFIRTTDSCHEEFCQLIFTKMKENGDIYKGDYEGLYCVGCEKFIKEMELEDGKCPLHKTEPTYLKEESYFFRLSAYQQKLLNFYEENPDFIAPAFRKAEIVNRILEGLNDLSVSRTSITWGIPIPDDPEHVMYVWIDALSNYISALGYPDGENYAKFWPADVHLVGKDIAWFHMVIWPAMLMSAGFPLPKKVFAHGFWTVDGQKMSKALGNVVRPLELKVKYGNDALRYYLFSKAEFGQDNDFSEKQMVDVLNTELADDLGNLVNRLLVLTQKYFNGVVPSPPPSPDESEFEERCNLSERVATMLDECDFSGVLRAIWDLFRFMNKTISEAEPWVLYKNKEMEKLESFLFTLLEAIRIGATYLAPFMPGTSAQILDALGIEDRSLDTATWRNPNGFQVGHPLGQANLILFTKQEYSPENPPAENKTPAATENKPVKNKISKKNKTEKISTMSEEETADIKPQISYEDFVKLDIRSARILAAEPFPDSKKLVKLDIQIGSETRTIVAGIGKVYKAEDLVDKNIIVLANLEPKKLHGVMSNGMLLAVDINDEPILLTPDRDVETGYPVH